VRSLTVAPLKAGALSRGHQRPQPVRTQLELAYGRAAVSSAS